MSALKAWTTLTARGEPRHQARPGSSTGTSPSELGAARRGLQDRRVYYRRGSHVARQGHRRAQRRRRAPPPRRHRARRAQRGLDPVRPHRAGQPAVDRGAHGVLERLLRDRVVRGSRPWALLPRRLGRPHRGQLVLRHEGFAPLHPNCVARWPSATWSRRTAAPATFRGTTAVEYRNGFCGFSRGNQYSVEQQLGGDEGFFRADPLRPTSGNKTIDMVLHDPSDSRGSTDCGSAMAMSGTLTVDPGFMDRRALRLPHEQRVARASSACSRDLPGPRW